MMQYTYLPRLPVMDGSRSIPPSAVTAFATRRSDARMLRAASFGSATAAPLPRRLAGLAVAFSRDVRRRDPAVAPLAGFRMFAAPAGLPGCRHSLVLEDFLNLLDQILGKTRFRDERVASGALRAFGNTGQCVTGQRDHRNRGCAVVGFQPTRRFPSVHDRQRQ